MVEENTGKYWLVLVGISLSQVLLYHLGIVLSVFFLFSWWASILQIPIYYAFLLVPLQRTLLKRGNKAFFITMGLSFTMLVIIRIYMASMFLREPQFTVGMGLSLAGISGPIIVVELCILACLSAGTAFLNMQLRTPMRMVNKLLSATAVAGLMGILLGIVFSRNQSFLTGMQNFFLSVQQQWNVLIEAESPITTIDDNLLLEGIWQFILSGFIFGYFVNLLVGYYGGTAFSGQYMARSSQINTFQKLRLPDTFVWPLVISWGVVLLHRILVLRGIVLSENTVLLNGIIILVRNIGMIFLLLYGIQGLSIIRHILRRRKIVGMWYYLFIVILVLIILGVILYRPATLVAAVFIPGVGVSEIWIKIRTTEKENGEDEDNS